MPKESTSFEHAADFYDETRGGLDRGRPFGRTIAPYLPAQGKVLEIGVGTGLIALPLRELDVDIVGVDIAPAMLAKALDRIGPRVVVGDATQLPVGDARVDAVVAVWVLHVVGDRAAALAECARAVRPGGRLIVVPGDAQESDDEVSRAIGDMRVELGRTRDLAPIVEELATAAGFDLVEHTFMPRHTFETSPIEAVAWIERRETSALWDLDEDTWGRIVQPVIGALNALPEPERPRTRTAAGHLLVFERPAR